jgi:hypothetical protein
MECHLKHCQELAKERVTWHLVNEEMPFTLNTHYLADYKDKFLAYYKAARDQDYCADLKNAIQKYEDKSDVAKKAKAEATGIAKILSGFAEIGMSVKPEDLGKLLPPDPMEPALVIMADVRAYFRGESRSNPSDLTFLVDHYKSSRVQTNCRQRSYCD